MILFTEEDEPIFDAFTEQIKEAKTIFITAHVGPDGDTLGSMLGLKFAFEKAYDHIQSVDCVISGKMPDVYKFLPGIREVNRIETFKTGIQQYDMGISVDCGSIDRLGPAGEYFKNAKVSVNIDHHISNDEFGSINIIDTKAAASGEVIFDLLKHLGIAMDASIATNLYTAIVTDTGGFKYSNTTAKVLEVTSKLVAAGASPEYIFKELYEERPKAQLTMQADAFLNAQYSTEDTVGWSVVDNQLLEKHGALDEHVDGLVEHIRRVDTVMVAAIFKETADGGTKVSMRSDTHQIDVAAIAGIYGGGGHKLAAGFKADQPVADIVKDLVPRLEAAALQAKAPVKA